MAITNAQQYKQLVNPPLDGKRPGYRGDAAARSTGAKQSGRADPGAMSDPGEGTDSQGRSAPTEGMGAGEGPSGRDDRVDPRRVKESREEFLRANPPATLTALKQRGVRGIPFGFPGSSFFNAIRGFRDYTLGKNIDYFSDLKNRAIVRGRDPRAKRGIDRYERSAAGYKEYMADRLAGKIDAAGNLKAGFMEGPDGTIISTGNDGRDTEAEQQALIAQAVNPNQATTPTQPTSAIDPIFFRLAADGGMIEDAPVGGIMDLESGRQMYFLGKLVKKATRAVKKIVKSPIGKAAILGGAAYFGAPLFKSGAFKNFFLKDAAKGFALKNISGAGIASIIGGASLLPLIFGDKEEDQVELDRGPMLTREQLLAIRGNPFGTLAPRFGGSQFAFAADGGRIGYQEGSKEPVAKKTMPLLDMGGQEMDLRAEGGFVPIGRMEKADDVPARLSKNEFVFTADAVRNAGDGSVDKGAEVMYNMMKNLEAGGSVSKESQGQEGARRMFQTSKRLEEVL
jgi:hypothetical protein